MPMGEIPYPRYPDYTQYYRDQITELNLKLFEAYQEIEKLKRENELLRLQQSKSSLQKTNKYTYPKRNR